MNESPDSPSQQLVLQRVRNRIIEHLELAGSFEQQLRYEANVPIADVPAEVMCGWEDWVNDGTLPAFGPPVFTAEEVGAVRRFDRVWQSVSERLPRHPRLPRLNELHAHREWQRLRDEALITHQAFQTRGKLPEETEISAPS